MHKNNLGLVSCDVNKRIKATKCHYIKKIMKWNLSPIRNLMSNMLLVLMKGLLVTFKKSCPSCHIGWQIPVSESKKLKYASKI